jgi:colanic acid biosynthesis glycosyl transferase WcaI
MADLHLLPQLRGAADLVLPSKLSGMLASARPVIAAADPESEIATIVRRCGVRVTPEDAESFTQAIVTLCDDDGRRRELGAAARHLAESALGQGLVLGRLAHELAVLRHGDDRAPCLARHAAPP